MINKMIGAKYGMPEIIVCSHVEITPKLIEGCKNFLINQHGADKLANIEKESEWILKNPDFCFVFIKEYSREIVGVFFALPMKIETIIRFFRGQISTPEMTLEHFDTDPTKYMLDLQVYTSSFKDEYCTNNMSKLLFEMFLDSAIRKAKGGKYINYIYLEKITEFDNSIIKIFDMEFLCKSKLNRDIFGENFNMNKFAKLSNYPVLEFAYTNIFAKQRIERTDLFKLSKN